MFDGLASLARYDSRPLANGTIARHDGVGTAWTNKDTGQGGKMDRTVRSVFRAGAPCDDAKVRDLMGSNALARRVIWREIEDALREGFTVTGGVHGGELTTEDQAGLERWGQRLNLDREISRARMWARARGLGLWALGLADGRKSTDPIDFAALQSVRWIRTIEPHYISVQSWNDDFDSPRFGQPEIYRLGSRSAPSFLAHWSRVIRWEGADLGDEYERDHESFGASVLDLVWLALMSHGVSHQYAVEALQVMTQGVFQSPSLDAAIMAGNAEEARKRYEILRLGMGLLGDIALGKGESYNVTQRPISGVKDVIEAVVSALVAATDMPRTILLGEQPAGLNASADSEIRAWYDHVKAVQRNTYTPPILRLLEIATRAADGPTCGCPIVNLGLEWPALWQLTAKEQAEVRKLNADARKVDLDGRVISVDEARSDPSLAEVYELQAREIALPDEAEMAAESMGEQVEVADPREADPNEPLIAARAASDMLGFKSSPGPLLGFCKSHGVPVFRPGAQYKFSPSMIMAALRDSQVE